MERKFTLWFKRAVIPPLTEALVGRLPKIEEFEQVPPFFTGVKDLEDTIE